MTSLPSSKIKKAYTVILPVTSIWGLLKKLEVKTKTHSIVQLAVPYLLVSFQRLLPMNEKLYKPLCQWFYRAMTLLSRSNVSSCSLLPLRVGNPLFTDGLIVSCARGVQFFVARFCLAPLSSMKQVPFESTGIGLQYMQKLSMYTRHGLRYTLWYAD